MSARGTQAECDAGGAAHNAGTGLLHQTKRAREGDEDAFGAIYRARVGAVSRYVGSIVRDPNRIEDVVAQTFVLAWRDLPRLRQPERFDAWLFRIAHNQAMSELRRRPFIPLEGVAEPADESRTASPSAVAEAGADAEAVRNALARLPDVQRDVLVMRFFLDLPHADVARQLGKSEEATRVLQYRALARMRTLMAADR